MDIEKIATSAVLMSLSKTDRLSGFINSGDKEPCWDGNIYIHESKKRTKKNIKKVATQVKGKLVKSSSAKETIKYGISHDDLYAYMMNGGTMFYVVYIDNASGEPIQIYYASLLPFTIKSILKESKSIYQVEFERFPNNNLEKTEILLNFYNNAHKQASFAGKELPTIEELLKKGLLESISFHYTSVGKSFSEDGFPKIIDGKSITLYANIKGGVAPIPVQYFKDIHHVTMRSGKDTPVSVNGEIFYNEIDVVTTAEKRKIIIGSCIELEFPNTTEPHEKIPVKIETKIGGTLNERILGVEFILSILKHGSFHIGEGEFPYIYNDEKSKEDKIAELEVLLSQLKRIKSVLDAMNVKTDLNIQDCNQDDFKGINLIIGTIGEGRPIKEGPKNPNEVQTIIISNIKLAVIYLKNKKGGYQVFDYFGNRFHVSWKTPEGETIRLSQYTDLRAKDFLAFDNLNLQSIIDDFANIDPNEYVVDSANRILLEMLKANDEKASQEILNAAKRMSVWLSSQTKYIPKEITTINELQIILRERQLSYTEKSKLYEIISTSTEDHIKLGALLLLDEQEEASKIMGTFDEEQLDNFREFPIYHFYKGSNDETTEQTS